MMAWSLNDPSQTVATARIAHKLCQASPPHLAHNVPDLIQIGSLSAELSPNAWKPFLPHTVFTIYTLFEPIIKPESLSCRIADISHTRFDAVDFEVDGVDSGTLVPRDANLARLQRARLMSVALVANAHQQAVEVRTHLGGRRRWTTLGVQRSQPDQLHRTHLASQHPRGACRRPFLCTRRCD